MSAAFSFEYTFVSQVPDEYMCPICNCPMREPVQTKCGHRFCKHCLAQALKRNRECPIDRTPLNDRRKRDIYPDVAIKRTILDFQVRCSNEGHGCRWIGELRTVEKHVASCSFTRVRCTNEGCETTLFKGDLQNHVTNECTKRALVCKHCHTSYIWCLQEKHFMRCEKFPCLCLQNCGQEDIPRNKMDDHISRVCPRTEVDCTYSNVGCRAKVQRQVLLQHVKDNVEFHLTLACEKIQVLQAEVVSMKKEVNEVSAMCPGNESIRDLREKVRTVNEQMRTIRTEAPRKENIYELNAEVIAGNESIKELREEVRTVNKKLKIIWTEAPRKDEIYELNAEVAATNQRLEDLIGPMHTIKFSNNEFLKLEEDVTATNQRLQDLRAEIVSARKSEEIHRKQIMRNALELEWVKVNGMGVGRLQEIEETLEGLDQRQWKLDKARDQMEIEVEKQKKSQTQLLFNDWLVIMSVVACALFCLHSHLEDKLKKNEIQLVATKERLKKLDDFLSSGSGKQQFLSEESTCSNNVFIWKFTDFQSRLKQAKSKKKIKFFSEPFHVGPSSYKMCIAIYPNGYDDVRNTHLSVFVFLLRSNIDDILPWPFKKEIVLTLVDQQHDPAMRKDIRFSSFSKEMTDIGNALERPSAFTEREKGFGVSKFISLTDLDKRRYIVHDTIYLKVEDHKECN